MPRLTLLVPDIIESVLDGRKLAQTTLPVAMKGSPRWGGKSSGRNVHASVR